MSTSSTTAGRRSTNSPPCIILAGPPGTSALSLLHLQMILIGRLTLRFPINPSGELHLGAGKGTVGDLLQAEFGVVPISTGQLLRDEISRDSKLGREVKELVESGQYVHEGKHSHRLQLEMVGYHIELLLS